MLDYESLIDITGITLCLTDACNLRCKYCFVNQSPNYMSLQTAKDSVDFLIKKSKNDFVNIRLFGGEPLLVWNQIIVPLVQYAKDKNYKIRFSIVSNGILLSQDKIDFMKKNNIKFFFSMDGDKETQDENRPLINNESSFDILKEKIPMILDNYPNIVPRGTIVSDKVQNLYKDIMFLKNCGFKQCSSFVNELEDWSDTSIEILKSEIAKYMIYFISEQSKETLSTDFIKWHPFYYGLKEYIELKKKSISNLQPYGIRACGLGLNDLNINYNGDIFTCNNLVTHDIENNPYYIGNIYSNIDKSRHIELLKLFIGQKLISEEPDLCKDCIRKSICNKGFCHSKSFIKLGKLNVKTKIRCLFDSFLVNYSGFAYEVLFNSENNNVFKKSLKTDF